MAAVGLNRWVGEPIKLRRLDSVMGRQPTQSQSPPAGPTPVQDHQQRLDRQDEEIGHQACQRDVLKMQDRIGSERARAASVSIK